MNNSSSAFATPGWYASAGPTAEAAVAILLIGTGVDSDVPREIHILHPGGKAQILDEIRDAQHQYQAAAHWRREVGERYGITEWREIRKGRGVEEEPETVAEVLGSLADVVADIRDHLMKDAG